MTFPPSLFVHERLSTKGIIETLQGHRKDKGAEQLTMAELFGDPQLPVTDQVLIEVHLKWFTIRRHDLAPATPHPHTT